MLDKLRKVWRGLTSMRVTEKPSNPGNSFIMRWLSNKRSTTCGSSLHSTKRTLACLHHPSGWLATSKTCLAVKVLCVKSNG